MIKIDFSGGGEGGGRRQQRQQPGVPTRPPSPAQGDHIIRSDPLSLTLTRLKTFKNHQPEA